ncbi:Golgi apparatus protein 1-like [Orbicella faveolata]|uniref:Golgi apparatus protein 1-like n=1 Tax=Orbicella faveolata TaxID=48498 RepID=UPI0009E1F500|nr:Golgi apparatus protein 1-like [Orbicella faveolata]
MENLHTDNMIPECEEQLLHLEFFIARDIELDPVLKKACQDDVKTICNAPNLDDQDSYPSSLIISCLYRHVVLDPQRKVSPKCAAHVQRVMHQRAVDVHLMPEIQTACVQDLAKHCSEQLGKGEVIDLNKNTIRTLWKEFSLCSSWYSGKNDRAGCKQERTE